MTIFKMRYMHLFLILAVALVSVLPVKVAHADVNDFTVTDFTADYALGQADPQGTLQINEQLTVDYTGNNHGILRALPERYNGQDQHISISQIKRDGADEKYTTYTTNGNLVIKIGDANRTLTGEHTYEITYKVDNVIRFNGSTSELIWNTNGIQWTQPFMSETARLHVPSQLAGKLTNLDCFTGVQGSTAHDCSITTDGATTTITSDRELLAGETMTFAASIPAGVFHKPTASDWWNDNGLKLAALIAPVLLATIVAYRKWRRDGKDIRGRGTIIPEYAPPNDMNPALADSLLNYQLSHKGISATIIDLAIRKHLKIVESKSDGVLGIGKHKIYSFEKLELATVSLLPHERAILSGLFSGRSSVQAQDLKGSFYTTVALVKSMLSKQLTDDGYLPKTKLPEYLTFIFWIIGYGAAAAIAGQIMPTLTVGLAFGVLVFIFFTLLMPKRLQKGVDAKDSLEGLKLYMNTAEKDRLAKLQSTTAPYALRSEAPQQTVELFEKLLPYAIVLGVEQSWAKQFENIYTSPPDWYQGNWIAFNAGYLVSSLNSSVAAMNSSFAAPSSSSTGGGGGFSGGGGGGGGGGGW